jgi:hypothetical protein
MWRTMQEDCDRRHSRCKFQDILATRNVSDNLLQTVGAGGGWVQGGGHGFFSNRFGLGVDNVLELEVVLPNGAVVIANAESYQDLFWALRGGGGGTFGIVTKVTLKAHPCESLYGIQMTITPDRSGQSGFTQGMAFLISSMAEWTDFGISGYPILERTKYSSLFTAPGKTAAQITEFLKPYTVRLESMGLGVSLRPVDTNLNAFLIAHDMALNSGIPGTTVGQPQNYVQGTRLWCRAGLQD